MGTLEQMAARELMAQKVEDNKQETWREASERQRTICKTCYYMGGTHPQQCDYIGVEKHQRPCAPCRCVEMGVYKPGRRAAVPSQISLQSERKIFIP